MASGLNAAAHAVEALYAPDRTPVTDVLAERARAAFFSALPAIHADPDGSAAREEAPIGSWLAGTCLGMLTMSVHHKIVHVLGGTFEMPHAPTHAVLLPHVLGWVAPDATAAVGQALGTSAKEAAPALQALGTRLGLPDGLSELGFHLLDADRTAALARTDTYASPRPVDAAGFAALLRGTAQGLPAGSHP